MNDNPAEPGMTNEQAAQILARMHLSAVKTSARVHRKRSLKPSEKAMWLSDLRQQRIALSLAYKALTGRDLTAP